MATHSTVWTGIMSSAGTSIAVRDVVVVDGDDMRIATTANRASYGRSVGVAITAADANNPAFEYQVSGLVPTAITGLGAGSVSWVRVASDGSLERCTPASGDDLIGKCLATGDLLISPGVWDSNNYNPTAVTATSVSATGNTRCKIYSDIASVQTTDATVTSIFTWTITDEAVTAVTVEVCADKSDGSATASYVRRVRIKRDGGTVTVGSVEDTYTSEDSLNGDVTVDNSGSTGRVRVTGVAGTTIDWGCVVTRMEVTHA